MSSHIVDNKTIDRILSIMKHNKLFNQIDGPTVGDCSKFGQELLDMNVSAYNQRYEEQNEKIDYTFNECPVTKIQGLKSLNGFLYQCSEGDVFDTELYKQMRSVSGELANCIVQNLPAYEAAQWA